MTNLVVRGSWIFDMRTDLLHCSMCFTSLFLHLLIMLMSPVKCESICSRESVVMVTKILEELSKAENEPNCMLYTPTLADFENCTRSTLRCYELELNVLPVEIQSVATSSKKLLSILKKLKLRIKGVEQLFHKQNSDADPEDGVVAPEIHCPHHTRILFCSDTSPMDDWDLDLQTLDIVQRFKFVWSSRLKQTQCTNTQEVCTLYLFFYADLRLANKVIYIWESIKVSK